MINFHCDGANGADVCRNGVIEMTDNSQASGIWKCCSAPVPVCYAALMYVDDILVYCQGNVLVFIHRYHSVSRIETLGLIGL